MTKRLGVWIFICLILINLSGCALFSGGINQQKEPQLKWNVSYLRGLVLVREALKTQPVKFENAVISKDAAKLKGVYLDGKIVQIIISKITNTESSVEVKVLAGQRPKEDAQDILEAIVQYSKAGRNN